MLGDLNSYYLTAIKVFEPHWVWNRLLFFFCIVIKHFKKKIRFWWIFLFERWERMLNENASNVGLAISHKRTIFLNFVILAKLNLRCVSYWKLQGGITNFQLQTYIIILFSHYNFKNYVSHSTSFLYVLKAYVNFCI